MTRMTHRLKLLPFALALVASTSLAQDSEADKQAASIYSLRCAGCHGQSGQGDGNLAAALNPKPRDLTTADWQDSVQDDYIERIILEGGAAVGKSMMMPGNPDLKSKPEVVKSLRAMVRKMRAD